MDEENEDLFKAESKEVSLPRFIGRMQINASKLKPRVENEILSVDDDEGDRNELFNSVAEHGFRIPLLVESAEATFDETKKEYNSTLEFTVIAGHRRLAIANDPVASESMKILPCVIYPPLTPEQRDELDRLSNISRVPTQWQAAVRWYRLKKANSSRLALQSGVDEEIGRQIPKLQQIAKISDAKDTMKKTVTVIREIERLFQSDRKRALEIRDKAVNDGWIAAYRTLRPVATKEPAQELQSDQRITPVILLKDELATPGVAENDISHLPDIACEKECDLPTFDETSPISAEVILADEKTENIPEIVSASAPPDAGRNLKTIKDGLRALSRVLDNLEKAGLAVEPHKQHRMDIEDFLVRSYKELSWK